MKDAFVVMAVERYCRDRAIREEEEGQGVWPLKCRYCTAGTVQDVKWKRVKVGDLLQVRDDEDIPADLVCVGCSHPDNVCFIKTTNLDGAPFFIHFKPFLKFFFPINPQPVTMCVLRELV